MKSLLSPRTAIVASCTLTACQAPAQKTVCLVIKPSKTAGASLTQRELGDGLYEMVYAPAAKALFVASAQGFKDVNGGVSYRLDPANLATKGKTHTDLKNFGMAADSSEEVFYATNTLDGGVSKVDGQSGKVLQRLMFKGKDKDGDPIGAREVLFHNGELFIGGVADPGFISVVDAKSMTLKKRIPNAGKWRWRSAGDQPAYPPH